MLKASNIYKSFGNVKVLENLDFHLPPSAIVAICGKSGSGKSTLLHILGTLEKPDKGTLTLDGLDLLSMNDKEICRYRNQSIGFVFQFHHLLPEFTALENVLIPYHIYNNRSKQSEQQAKQLLDLMGMSHRLTHKPNQLSGGEKQRVAIARALINKPKLVLADEPTGNLDDQTTNDIQELIFMLRRELNQAFVLVTHNTQLADLCDQTYHLTKNKLQIQ